MTLFTNVFSKITLLSVLLLSLGGSLYAQQLQAPAVRLLQGQHNASDDWSAGTVAPAELVDNSAFRTPGSPATLPTTDAMWDVLFSYNMNDTIPGALINLAGCGWTGTEFWVSDWTSDQLFRFTPTGSLISQFTIDNGSGTANISGTRGFAWDGTNIYIGNNTTTVYIVDPTTQTVTGTITAPAAVRFIAYDPTADGGNGGFFIGGFSTPIIQMSMTGATLNTIPYATFNLNGAYGAAVDTFSVGGPYLWLFHQVPTGGSGLISQLQLPSGTPTGIIRDANADVGAGTSGGLFIDRGNLVPGKDVLGGVMQGSVLFGYDLDFVQIQVDANLSVFTGNGMTQIPVDQVAPWSYEGEIVNGGLMAISSAVVSVSIDTGGVNLFSDSQTLSNIPSADAAPFSLGPFTPPAEVGGPYFVTGAVSITGQVDENVQNDSTEYAFFISDSTFARDNGSVAGSLGFGASEDGLIGQVYTVNATSQLTSVSVGFLSPPQGQSIVAKVYTMGAVVPDQLIYTSAPFVPGPADTSLIVHDFVFTNSILPAMTYYIAVEEVGANVRIAYTNDLFTPQAGLLQFASSGNWNYTESAGFPVSYVIRPNFSYCVSFDALAGAIQDNGGDSGAAFVLASGGTSPYTYSWSNGATTDTAIFLTAGFYSVTVTDGRGCSIVIDSVEVLDNTGIEDQLAGIEVLKAFPNPSAGQFTLEIELAQASDLRISVMDLAGRTVYAQTENRVQNYLEQIDLSKQSQGVYVLRVETAKGMTYRRLIVE